MGMFGQSLPSQQIPQNVDPRLLEPMPQKKRGMFGGKAGGILGDILGTVMMGPAYLAFKQGQKDGAPMRDLQMRKAEAEMNPQPQFQNVAGVGLVKVNPDGTTETAVPAQSDPVAAPAGVREWEYMQNLPPELREQFQKFRQPVPYGYTPQGIQAQAQIAGATAAARAPYQSSGGGGGGPAKIQATRSLGGKAYYKVNGEWYDNPEGR